LVAGGKSRGWIYGTRDLAVNYLKNCFPSLNPPPLLLPLTSLLRLTDNNKSSPFGGRHGDDATTTCHGDDAATTCHGDVAST